MTTSYTTSDLPPPPLPESDVPLMGNPILTRRVAPKRSANIGWYIGVPVAFVAVGALAFVIASGAHNQPSLMTTTAPATQAAATPAPTPAPVPVPAAPAQVAAVSPTETPVAPPAAITPRPQRVAREDHAAAVHRTDLRHARAAEDSGADASAIAPITPPPAPMIAPAPEAAPPVLTPPPPGQ